MSRTTLRTLLKQAGLSWKKSKKALGKANPKKRAEFVAEFQAWFEQVCQGQVRLIYIDEVHLHQDLALGYRWSSVGEADWVASHCPPLKNRLNWYGAYDFSHGQCLIWHQESCDSESTVAFLQHLALKWPADPANKRSSFGMGRPAIAKPSLSANKRQPWGLPSSNCPPTAPI